jgi:hypothetical protein
MGEGEVAGDRHHEQERSINSGSPKLAPHLIEGFVAKSRVKGD